MLTVSAISANCVFKARRCFRSFSRRVCSVVAIVVEDLPTLPLPPKPFEVPVEPPNTTWPAPIPLLPILPLPFPTQGAGSTAPGNDEAKDAGGAERWSSWVLFPTAPPAPARCSSGSNTRLRFIDTESSEVLTVVGTVAERKLSLPTCWRAAGGNTRGRAEERGGRED